jgi:hypothetical protein
MHKEAKIIEEAEMIEVDFFFSKSEDITFFFKNFKTVPQLKDVKSFKLNLIYVPKAKLDARLHPKPKSELDNIPRTIPAFGIWQIAPGLL